MNPNADHIKSLSPDRRQRLEQLLKEFETRWSPTAMSEAMAGWANLPMDRPLRHPLLIELTRLDLPRRWQLGQRITLEEYLLTYPELGSTHTLPVELVRAEYDARIANGDRVDLAEYARRFPNQYSAFHRSLTAPASAAPDPGVPQTVPGWSPANVPAPAGRAPAPATAPLAAPPASPAPKRRARWPWLAAAALLLLLGGGLGWMGYQGGFNDPKKFLADLIPAKVVPPPSGTGGTGSTATQRTNKVESLTVKLDLGAGDDLQEAVGLDLGLGFPLWLVPGGPLPPSVPFGAVPQQTTASGKVPASSSATFTFLTSGEPGQDVLATTPQLLAGVQVGDIRRVGFTGLAQQDWELAGFEIQVNGQTLHSARGLKVRPRQVQEEATKNLAALNQKGAPIDKERTDLRDLVESGLASDAEKARLKELEQQTAAGPSLEEKTRLEGQLKGTSPWYVETIPASAPTTTAAGSHNLFDLLTPRAHAVGEAATSRPRSVRVTVVTDPGSDKSDTSNYVYFIAGRRKYLIGGPDAPLTSTNGPQTFDLDLLSGPLDSSDLRGFGLGMLAPAKPVGKGPNRWHPRRVQVEVDGKNVYDSELVPTDLQTLDVIRLVPPRQLDLDGTSVVTNTSNSRELYVWEAGKATGFDPKSGAANPLPLGTITENGEVTGGSSGPVVDPVKPPDVKDLVKPLDLSDPNDLKKLIDPKQPIDPNTPILPGKLVAPNDPSDPKNPSHPPLDGFQPLTPIVVLPFPPPSAILLGSAFPGEIPFNNPLFPNPAFPNPAFPGAPGNPAVPPNPGQPTIIIINQPAPTPNPPVSTKPINKPLAPQIGSVDFVHLGRSAAPGFCRVAISWKMFDESGVDHYEVKLQGLEDDLSGFGLTPHNGQSQNTMPLPPNIPRGVNFLPMNVPDSFILAWRFVRPVVTPVPTDPSITAIDKFGPARSTVSLQPPFLNASWTFPQQLQVPNLPLTVQTLFSTHTVFDVICDSFAENRPVIVPLDPTKSMVTLSLLNNKLPVHAEPATIRFYTGFLDGVAPASTIDRMEYRVEAFANEAPAFGGGVTTTIPLTNVLVPGLTADPKTGFFTLDGSKPGTNGPSSVHAVSVLIPPTVTQQIKQSNKAWTIELTISMRNASRPAVVFDATILK